MFNQLTLAGRATNQPVLNKSESGHSWCKIGVAVKRAFKNKENNEYDTDFFDIVAWNSLAERCAEHIKKGDVIFIKARLENVTYKSKDGVNVKTVNIIGEQVVFVPAQKTRELESAEEE